MIIFCESDEGRTEKDKNPRSTEKEDSKTKSQEEEHTKILEKKEQQNFTSELQIQDRNSKNGAWTCFFNPNGTRYIYFMGQNSSIP